MKFFLFWLLKSIALAGILFAMLMFGQLFVSYKLMAFGQG
jgi:hypothetical protein